MLREAASGGTLCGGRPRERGGVGPRGGGKCLRSPEGAGVALPRGAPRGGLAAEVCAARGDRGYPRWSGFGRVPAKQGGVEVSRPCEVRRLRCDRLWRCAFGG